MKTIGERLKEIRDEKGFPQKQIAELLGVQRPNYSKIENNKQNLTPKQLKQFCEFFNVSADYILDISIKDKKTINKYVQEDILNKLESIKQMVK